MLIKRLCLLAIAIFLAYCPAHAEVIVFHPDFDSDFVKFASHGNSDSVLAIDVGLAAVRSDIIATDGGDFALIEIDGSGETTDIGSPKLPVIRRLVQIPEGATVNLTAQGEAKYYSVAQFTGASQILPRQPGVEKIPGAASHIQFAYDRQVYESDAWFFDRRAELGPIGRLRGKRVAWLSISPVDYNPHKGLLKIYPELHVTLEFSDADWEGTRDVLSRYDDPRTHAIVEGLALNRQDFSEKAPVTFSPSSYLIIGSSEFYDASEMRELIAFKKRKGYQVVFYDETQYATSDDVKALIKDAYESWDLPPSYVLLLGDTNIVPACTGESPARPTTDYPYQLMDSGDPFPDLAVGRFPARTVEAVSKIAAKTLHNELARAPIFDWVKRATFMASVDNFSISEGTHNHVISTYMIPNEYESTKLYTIKGATTQQVRASVNAGLSLLTYSGHGAVTHWSDGPYFDQADVNALHNAYFPFVMSYACVTGNYYVDEVFGETWVLADYGAVAFWGSVLNSLWEEDDILERLVYEGYFRGGGTNRMIPWVSGMTDYGKIGFWGHYGGLGYSLRYLEMYNLMGDPEQMVFSEPPVTPDVDIWGSVTESGVDVSFEVADNPHVMVGLYLFESGENLDCAFGDNTGYGAMNYRKEMTKGEQLFLTFTGHNLIPLTLTLTVGEDLPEPPAPDDDDDVNDDATGDDDDDADDDAQDAADDDDDSDDSGACCG